MAPYSRPVADRVLKIVRMASDETAELEKLVRRLHTHVSKLGLPLYPQLLCVGESGPGTTVQLVDMDEVAANIFTRSEPWLSL